MDIEAAKTYLNGIMDYYSVDKEQWLLVVRELERLQALEENFIATGQVERPVQPYSYCEACGGEYGGHRLKCPKA